MNSPKTEIKERSETHGAFTIVELLVVIGTVALLAMMLLPALADTRPNSQLLKCKNNLRQLQLGWLAYSADSAEAICPTAGTAYQGTQIWSGTSRMDLAGEDTDATDLQQGLLWPYVKSLGPYKCPADPKLSQNIPKRPTVRSISCNAWMNPMSAYNSSGRVFRKQTDIANGISPSTCWVFIDENEKLINDGWFVVTSSQFGPSGNEWVDIPGSYQNKAGGLAFADGHTEIKKWRDKNITGPNPYLFMAAYPANNYADLRWLQQRTTVPEN